MDDRRASTRRSARLHRVLRALLLLATSTLVVCGVKGPPHPPEQLGEAMPDASAAADARAALPDSGATFPDAGAPSLPNAGAPSLPNAGAPPDAGAR